ncbi:hypothetical protein MCUN1_000119 [Malassezia cuniculi]|uniref:GPI transamidase subunit PIG-U n=1 Tax=Malassezia cuniculi TaxID=948313 RepID=A0AAF0EMZ7_9BASI|nr:hypothetical protein MCUN1_000119 [Malassezia cuniculi]
MRITFGTGVALVSGAVVRAGASWWSEWGEKLIARTELAPPTDRIELLRETRFLIDKTNPTALWASLSVHHSPLLIALPESLVSNPVLSSAFFIALDVATAAALAGIASLLASRGMRAPSPAAVAAMYMLHPYAIACSIAKSLSALRALTTVSAVYCALRGSSGGLAILHSLGMLLFLIPALYTPLLVLLGADSYAAYGSWRQQFGTRRAKAWWQFTHTTLRRMIGLGAGGILLSAYIARDPSWEFICSVYGSRLWIDDLSPALGLTWYFFVEIFGHFRPFFTVVVNVHLWAYVVPVAIVFRNDPLFGLAVMSGLVALFQNYPSAGDTAVFLSLCSLFASRLADNLRHPMVTSLLFAYAALLLPVFHYLWLYAGSANANFYFAAGLVHSFAIGAMILDAVWAWSVEQWEQKRSKNGPTEPESVRRIVRQT